MLENAFLAQYWQLKTQERMDMNMIKIYLCSSTLKLLDNIGWLRGRWRFEDQSVRWRCTCAVVAVALASSLISSAARLVVGCYVKWSLLLCIRRIEPLIAAGESYSGYTLNVLPHKVNSLPHLVPERFLQKGDTETRANSKNSSQGGVCAGACEEHF